MACAVIPPVTRAQIESMRIKCADRPIEMKRDDSLCSTNPVAFVRSHQPDKNLNLRLLSGVLNEHDSAKRLRDTRMTSIWEGINEVLAMQLFQKARQQLHQEGVL